jgi:hypothetical protein
MLSERPVTVIVSVAPRTSVLIEIAECAEDENLGRAGVVVQLRRRVVAEVRADEVDDLARAPRKHVEAAKIGAPKRDRRHERAPRLCGASCASPARA